MEGILNHSERGNHNYVIPFINQTTRDKSPLSGLDQFLPSLIQQCNTDAILDQKYYALILIKMVITTIRRMRRLSCSPCADFLIRELQYQTRLSQRGRYHGFTAHATETNIDTVGVGLKGFLKLRRTGCYI